MTKDLEGRYEHLVSAEYHPGAPFARTVVTEFDSIKGLRTTVLDDKSEKISFQDYINVKCIPKNDIDQYLAMAGEK